MFIATHSLFLMRELSILQSGARGDIDIHYFGLQLSDDGVVEVQQGADIADSGDIAALDENLEQSDRSLPWRTHDGRA